MGYQLIKFEEFTSDYNGKEIFLRTTSKECAKIKVLDVVRTVDTVNIKYEFISGDEKKFKPKAAFAILSRGKANWSDPRKYWLPYIFISTSAYELEVNNDGRDKCRFCGGETRRCGGWSSMTDYRICKQCGR